MLQLVITEPGQQNICDCMSAIKFFEQFVLHLISIFINWITEIFINVALSVPWLFSNAAKLKEARAKLEKGNKDGIDLTDLKKQLDNLEKETAKINDDEFEFNKKEKVWILFLCIFYFVTTFTCYS